MIDELKPYPDYKDSGVPWLGKVPGHWSTPRLKAVFREVDRRSGTGEEPLLSLRMQLGLVDHHAMGGKPIPASSLVHYKRTEPGEIVMNRMRAAAGLFAATRTAGLVSPDYAVLRPLTGVDLQYFIYLFRTPAMMSVFRLESRGLGTGESGFLRLYTERFGMLAAHFPALGEQTAIARFLDSMDRRIARYIRAKKKVIALLEEQKQVIVHRAVTRGLDANVRLKPSGAHWLGDVPEHWEVMALARVTLERCDGPFGSGLKTSHYSDEGVRVVRLQNVGFAEFNDADSAYVSLEHHESLGDHSVFAGDVLIAGLGDEVRPAGRACVAPASIEPAMVKADCFRFRLDVSRILPRFAALHLSATAAAASAVLSTGATRQRTNLQSTAARMIALPRITEQVAIVRYLDGSMLAVKAAINRIQREISLLREYRTRLIADVVTGKLDVREAASRVPDETDEISSFESIEETAQEDERELADGEETLDPIEA